MADRERPGRRILRFRAAGTACACDLEAVREIVRARAVTRLPGAAPWVLGIMNVRGALLTVVDLSARLRGTTDGTTVGTTVGTTHGAPAFVMVVEGAGRRFGIGVESVHGVADIAEDAIEPVGADAALGGIVGGLARLGDPDGTGGTAQWCVVEAIARDSLAV